MNKDSMLMINPFVVGRYAGEKYFCDREEETAQLIKQIENGRSVTLVAERRMGKTGLIRHLFHQPEIDSRYYTFFVDIYATSSVEELVRELSRAIFRGLKPRGKSLIDKFMATVKSLQFGIGVDPMTGEPSFQISQGNVARPEITLEEIFRYIDNADRPCIIAFDEFQQVAEYKDNNAEALLRTYIQNAANAVFIFAGSRRHMMLNMFNSAKRPFYNSTLSLSLGPIPQEKYALFASSLFVQEGKRLSPEVAAEIYRLVRGTTWYMQLLMNEGFALTRKGEEYTPAILSAALRNILDIQGDSYLQQLATLSPRQRALVRVIASEPEARELMSGGFAMQNGFTSVSSVQSALKKLVENEVVRGSAREGYSLTDYFFAEWLRREE